MDAERLDPKGYTISFEEPRAAMRSKSYKTIASLAAKTIREAGDHLFMTVWDGVMECVIVSITYQRSVVDVNADTNHPETAYIEKAIRNALAERVS